MVLSRAVAFSVLSTCTLKIDCCFCLIFGTVVAKVIYNIIGVSFFFFFFFVTIDYISIINWLERSPEGGVGSATLLEVIVYLRGDHLVLKPVYKHG